MKLDEPKVLKVRLQHIELGRKVRQRVRVMLTGDWHISPIVSERQLEFLREALERTQPDVIILQGDIVDSPIELKRETSLRKLMAELKACAEAAPTVMVLGSHDFITPTEPARNMSKFALPFWRKVCQKYGVRLLLNEWAEFPGLKIFGAFQDERCLHRADGSDGDSPEGFLAGLDENWDKVAAGLEKWTLEKVDCRGAISGDTDGDTADAYGGATARKRGEEILWLAAHAPLLNEGVLRRLAEFDVVSFGHTHGGVVPLGLDEAFEKLGWNFGLVSANHRPLPRRARGAMPIAEETMMVINAGMTGAQFCAPKPLQELNFLKAAEVSVVEVDGGAEL